MAVVLAHLGPEGTYAEMAALCFAHFLRQQEESKIEYLPCATIAKTLHCVAEAKADWAIVPVENSIGGSVPMTLDTLWPLENLTIHQALVLPIAHGLLSHSDDLDHIRSVASHPQALAQCRIWLDTYLPQAERISMNSTTEVLAQLGNDRSLAAIASPRAAALHHIPIQAHPINDNLENCTRFWVLNRQPLSSGSQTSLGFSLYANVPGALVKALQAFGDRRINMSRIESRPTQRSLGDYLFFIDLEDNAQSPSVQAALNSLTDVTENLRVLGSYDIWNLKPDQLTQILSQMVDPSAS
ncbi:MAG: prephenate dehydratase [Synechococcales cyanobacterium CRU_2_2]|nr:prephenate dehydratase [Synechococcales cyanobacterium CRU_2_2]